MSGSGNEDLIKITLQAAVPLWIAQLRGRSMKYVLQRAAECGRVVAEKGDVIQFRTKKKGASAKALNALAEGLACLAFAPGGVTFMGLHFEAKHEGRDDQAIQTTGDADGKREA